MNCNINYETLTQELYAATYLQATTPATAS